MVGRLIELIDYFGWSDETGEVVLVVVAGEVGVAFVAVVEGDSGFVGVDVGEGNTGLD